MKKALLIILALCMILAMSACFVPPVGGGMGSSNESDNESTNETKATEATTTSDPYKITYSSAKTYRSDTSTTWVQAIAEIENTGSYNLYLRTGKCDIEDSEGNLVASRDMSVYPQIIAPGEKAVYYDEYVIDSLPEPAELKIVPRPDVVKSLTKHVTYSVTDISIADYIYGGIKVVGRMENTSKYEESMIYVAVTLYNEASEPIGLVYTILYDKIAPGEKVGFEAANASLPDEVTADSVASYTAVAYPYQFQIDFY